MSSLRAVLCIALAVLSLYNPFFAVHGASQVLRVQHPFSYRGTVASSELGCCTILQAKLQVPLIQTAFYPSYPAPEMVPAVYSRPFKEVAHPVLQPVCNNIWFRPPPSL